MVSTVIHPKDGGFKSHSINVSLLPKLCPCWLCMKNEYLHLTFQQFYGKIFIGFVLLVYKVATF